MNKTVGVQMLKAFLAGTGRDQLDPVTILHSLLAVNFRETTFRDLRVLFQEPEKIARLHGRMLPFVTDKQHPVIMFHHQSDDFRALF